MGNKTNYHLKKKPYGNHQMISIDGKFLAHVDTKRMNWYLDRDLAKMVNKKDFQLTFKSKGDKERGEYYKLELQNLCVICGDEEGLTKHHVVPYQFRKYLPTEIKSKGSFDVLCLCLSCHHDYEQHADVLKNKMLVDNNLLDYNRNNQRVKKYHHVLNNHSDYLPDDRRSEMVEFLEDYLGNSIEDILEVEEYEFESATSLIMKTITDYKKFVIMWREHFIEFGDPKFLLQEWYDEMYTIIKMNEPKNI